MFPMKLFRVDVATKCIVATADDLGLVRGRGAIFEVIGETFGFGIDMGRGMPALFTITNVVERDDRITYIMAPSVHTRTRYPSFKGYRLIVVAKFN